MLVLEDTFLYMIMEHIYFGQSDLTLKTFRTLEFVSSWVFLIKLGITGWEKRIAVLYVSNEKLDDKIPHILTMPSSKWKVTCCIRLWTHTIDYNRGRGLASKVYWQILLILLTRRERYRCPVVRQYYPFLNKTICIMICSSLLNH